MNEPKMPEKNLKSGPRVLMLGYSGANNTGAEALLLADIEDVQAVLGPQAVITSRANAALAAKQSKHGR